MSYYELNKTERKKLDDAIKADIKSDLEGSSPDKTLKYFQDEDTYIRKSAYLKIRDILREGAPSKRLIVFLSPLLQHQNELVRQSTVNALGEIAIYHPVEIIPLLEIALHDEHHKVRNAVIGTLKKVGEKQPHAVIQFAFKYVNDPDPEVRRQVLHGVELRGRTHPEDILPLLREMQFEKVARVRNMLVHVLGQISYKQGTLLTVLREIQSWENQKLVREALEEILSVHERYEDFSEYTPSEAEQLLKKFFPLF